MNDLNQFTLPYQSIQYHFELAVDTSTIQSAHFSAATSDKRVCGEDAHWQMLGFCIEKSNYFNNTKGRGYR